jgi:hypothetical protein
VLCCYCSSLANRARKARQADTTPSINGIGPTVLRLCDCVFDFVSPAPRENEWKSEMEGWFETTLAKWQAFMVEFAYSTTELGSYGHLGFPDSNDKLLPTWRSQCQNQKTNYVGRYQNISAFGFMFAWTIDGILILMSWFLKLDIFGIPAVHEASESCRLKRASACVEHRRKDATKSRSATVGGICQA